MMAAIIADGIPANAGIIVGRNAPIASNTTIPSNPMFITSSVFKSG